MIATILCGLGLLVVMAVVIGVLDATHASAWRAIAAQRRERWEARKPQLHHGDHHGRDRWDDL